MSSVRLFVTAPLSPGDEVAGTPAQAHYLSAVMRRGVGDPVRLFNGTDGEWLARIRMLRREQASFVVERLVRPQVPEPDLWLAFSLLKRDATDLVVQKATELGVSALRPVLTERTIAVRANLERLRSIAMEAAEQSERLTIPTVGAPVTLPVLLENWPAGRKLIVAVERRAVSGVPRVTEPVALLVGPEGGFTKAELELLLARPFVSPASLGPRVLRAETACIVGLALIGARLQARCRD